MNEDFTNLATGDLVLPAWQISSTSTTGTVDTDGGGNKALKIVSSVLYGGFVRYFSTINGTSYTVKVKIKNTHQTNISIRRRDPNNYANYQQVTGQLKSASAGYVELTFTFTAQSGWEYYLHVQNQTATGTTVTYYADDLRVYYTGTVTQTLCTDDNSYRYGFNNQEKDNELYGTEGTAYAFEYRIHDTRLGRFLSVDPLAPEYPWNSSYAFAENDVISCLDLEGAERLNANEARVKIQSGRVVLNPDNFNKNTKNVYWKFVSNYKNWPEGEIGVDPTIFEFIWKMNPTPTASAPNDYNMTPSIQGNFATRTRYTQPWNNRTARRAAQGKTKPKRGIKVSLDNPQFETKAVKAFSKGTVLVDGLNFTVEQLDLYFKKQDAEYITEHAREAYLALQDVMLAFEYGMIPPKFQNDESFTKLANVVLIGQIDPSNPAITDPEIYKYGMYIYHAISNPIIIRGYRNSNQSDATAVYKNILGPTDEAIQNSFLINRGRFL